MDLDETYGRLGRADHLALAAAAAERVLPVYLRRVPYAADVCDDALRLVWYQVSGSSVTKQEVARVLNELIERIPTDDEEAETAGAIVAGQALVSTLEAALHGGDDARAALRCALETARSVGGEVGAREEQAWQRWAVARLPTSPERARDVLSAADAPPCGWLARLNHNDDLPLFGGRR